MPDNLPETGEKSGEMSPAADSNQQAQATGETPEQLRESLAKTQAALREANKEAAARRRRLEELETAEAARAEANKTEAQKLTDQVAKATAERDAALARAQDLALRNAVTIKASKLLFADPSDALAFLDRKALTINDDGSVDGLEDALKKLAAEKPYLLTTANRNLSGVQPEHGNQAAGETIAQKRARLRTGGPTADLSGGYVPIKQ